jgi:hypothetical protein
MCMAHFCVQLRLVVVGIEGLLTRVRYILQCLPLYVSTLWLLQSTVVSSKCQEDGNVRACLFYNTHQ